MSTSYLEQADQEKPGREMSTSYRVDQDAAGPVISLARHGAACSFKSNNVFMTPTGEYNQ